MATILPSINCHQGDLDAVVARCRQIEKIFEEAGTPPEDKWAHFDVADGIFTFHKSWNEPERLPEIAPEFSFEAHLMVEAPRLAAERWLKAGACRIIVHLESAQPKFFKEIAAAAHAANAEAFLALNPETPGQDAVPYFQPADGFLVLAVHPGLSGQKFLPAVLEKVSFLRQELPDAKIEVDGGMDPETARSALAAGANLLVSGSDIFGSPDPEGAYEELRSL